jgi:hypothetical protein
MNNQSAEILAVETRAREFQFTDSDFIALRTLVKEMTGINLTDSKRELVYGRVSRRLRALGLSTFGAYRELLESGDGAELVAFCNALTTNLTSFFRESHHFDYLRDAFLTTCRNAGSRSERIRIWSSACSSGEEPYSIAMTIIETIPDWQKWDIKILATDLDSDILARAQRGFEIVPARLQGRNQQIEICRSTGSEAQYLRGDALVVDRQVQRRRWAIFVREAANDELRPTVAAMAQRFAETVQRTLVYQDGEWEETSVIIGLTINDTFGDGEQGDAYDTQTGNGAPDHAHL